ncbi:MAG: hypothetical protein HC896_18100 [Bacteroidales bacterium]|nr:hypothetical protein [Bacteroidales bacterium]
MAKDKDAIPFRAPEEINQVIHKLGKKYGCPVIGLKSIYEKHSEHGIIGNELITEHLHPNIDGYFILMHAFFEKSILAIDIDSNFNQDVISQQDFKNSYPYTSLDSIVGLMSVMGLKNGFPFKLKPQKDAVLNSYRFQDYIDTLAYRAYSEPSFTIEEAHKKAAEHYKKTKMYLKAAKEYTAVTYINPLNTLAYASAFDMYYKAKEIKMAGQTLLRSLRYQPTYLAMYNLAKINFDKKAYNVAEGYFKSALEKFPKKSNNPDILYYLSVCYHKTGQSQLAADLEKKLKSSFPGFNPTKMSSVIKPVVLSNMQALRYFNQAKEAIKTNSLTMP